LLFEGENIGKANIWLYHFADEDDATNQIHLLATVKTEDGFSVYLNVDGYGSYVYYPHIQKIPIDLNNFEDSDVFVKNFVGTTTYNDNKLEMLNENEFAPYWIGIASSYSYIPEIDCFQEDKHLWIAYAITGITTNGSIEGFCCSSPYSNVEELSCQDFHVSIEESPIFFINVFPNPASTNLFVENLDGLDITNIEIFDVSGNLVSVFASGSTVIDISDLSIGSYFICFTVGNKKVYRSFIKE
jgi:hypothetical protein